MKTLEIILKIVVGLVGGWLFLVECVSTILLCVGMRFYMKDPNPPSKYELVQENLYRLK